MRKVIIWRTSVPLWQRNWICLGWGNYLAVSNLAGIDTEVDG